MKAQHGYTLVELMIALVLGLLISAAATQLLVTGSITLSSQQNSADIQDNAVFGMELMNRQLRQTNAGNSATISNTGSQNGVVFDATSIDGTVPASFPVTAQDKNSSSTNDAKSDQLVIQYQVLQTGTRDCEGNSRNAQDVIIERYFLRQDNLSSESPKPLALACAAFLSTNLAGAPAANGTIIMNRVEDLRVLMGTTTTAGQWQYYSISQYNALIAPKPVIRTIKLATLVRSTNADGATKNIDKVPSFSFLDQTVTVPNANDGYVRRVFTSTISFRNSLG